MPKNKGPGRPQSERPTFQQSVRLQMPIYDWLKDRVWSNRKKVRSPQYGVGTEINRIVEAAYHADQKSTGRKA